MNFAESSKQPEMANLPLVPSTYRTMRESMGKTRSELAATLGVAHETIARRERGESAITMEAWLALGHLFDMHWTESEEELQEPTEDEPEPGRYVESFGGRVSPQ